MEIFMSFGIVNAIWRARQNAAARVGERAPHAARNGYDPNQPRVPAGHADGGQWTHVASGHSPTEDVVINEDGSTVRSAANTSNPSAPWEERHTVRMPDGDEFTFEDLGFTQTVYDSDGRPIEQTVLTNDGPESQAIVQPARARVSRPGQKDNSAIKHGIEAALALFTALAAQDNRNRTTVLSYRASDYRTEEEPEPKAVWVGRLNEEEVRNTCRRYHATQRLVNEAARNVEKEDKYRDAADFGNKVHKEVELRIKEKNNPNWLAEPSLEKLEEQDPRIAEEARLRKLDPTRKPPEQPDPGSLDSIRVDVLDNQGNGTVCVYDIKTGSRHRLTLTRMAEIARAIYYHFPNTRRIIVAEMRPQR
jgi:hypothetical protein